MKDEKTTPKKRVARTFKKRIRTGSPLKGLDKTAERRSSVGSGKTELVVEDGIVVEREVGYE